MNLKAVLLKRVQLVYFFGGANTSHTFSVSIASLIMIVSFVVISLVINIVSVPYILHQNNESNEQQKYIKTLKSMVVDDALLQQLNVTETQSEELQYPLAEPFSEAEPENTSSEDLKQSLTIDKIEIKEENNQSVLSFNLINPNDSNQFIAGRICARAHSINKETPLTSLLYPRNLSFSASNKLPDINSCRRGELFRFKNLRPTQIFFDAPTKDISSVDIYIVKHKEKEIIKFSKHF